MFQRNSFPASTSCSLLCGSDTNGAATPGPWVRTPALSLLSVALKVSIHAPTRGTTSSVEWYQGHIRCFNSRPYTRDDVEKQLCLYLGNVFQFTPLHEGRLFRVTLYLSYGFRFNSRPYTRDDVIKPSKSGSVVFQFTPLHEGRPVNFLHGVVKSGFNSRPYTRDDTIIPRNGTSCMFQFTPLHEGRRRKALYKSYNFKFQFTPLHEGRLL